MQIEIAPTNIRTLAIRIRKRGKYINAHLTIPLDIIKLNKLEDKDKIVIAYVCKAGEPGK